MIESMRSAGAGTYTVSGCAARVSIGRLPVPVNGQGNLLSIGHLLHPSDVEAVEVYNSIEMPAMFGSGFDPVCGVTAIRARRGM